MNLIVTGASSFTGYWFCLYARRNGIPVTCTFTKRREDYSGLVKFRVESLLDEGCVPIWEATFGSSEMLSLLNSSKSSESTLAIHGAYTKNYKSDSVFRLDDAIMSNSNNLELVVESCAKKKISIVYSTTAFQGGVLPHKGKYGLSKLICGMLLRESCASKGVNFTEFIIANPFGPIQEGRFSNYIIDCVRTNQIPCLSDPWTIQDNILVESLARVFINTLLLNPSERPIRICPSQYLESNISFASRILAMAGANHLVSELWKTITDGENTVKIYAELNEFSRVFVRPKESEWDHFIFEKKESYL